MWARPSGLRTFEATFTFTFITARRLVVSPRETLSIGFRVLVSRHPAIQTTGPLILAPAGLSPAEHASLHWTHNRTCGPRIRLFGSISQSSSTSWAETCGGLRPFHIALSEAIRASNHDGG